MTIRKNGDAQFVMKSLMNKKITTELIEDKLFDLYQEYGKIKEDFDNAERAYILLKAQTYMTQEVSGLGTQVLRDSQCEVIVQQTEVGKTYLELKTKMDMINKGIFLWTNIAKVHTSWNN